MTGGTVEQGALSRGFIQRPLPFIATDRTPEIGHSCRGEPELTGCNQIPACLVTAQQFVRPLLPTPVKKRFGNQLSSPFPDLFNGSERIDRNNLYHPNNSIEKMLCKGGFICTPCHTRLTESSRSLKNCAYPLPQKRSPDICQ